MAGMRKERTLQEVHAAEIIKIEREAPMLVPCSSLTLRRRHQEGRLECFGSPLAVDKKHLLSQYRNGFKPVVAACESA